ncbi:hypothetical protein OKW21_003070 [Catalinimonas alkaloidigena]|uniref:hypothetical protein n=1 Tax=Catalinimonas alkaloidigena TaxID=1075417 RepID=UPI002407243D|nr:hypothetical protein [Catalinimonas alkaloidigena]MDF9797807.1 hypothetical protein [Catalinimonas alkaloidigena]
MKAPFINHFMALLICLISVTTFGQAKLTQLTLETGNAITGLPIVGAPQLFYTHYHPFNTIGASLVWKENGKQAWEQSFNMGYIYHRFVQHSILLFTETIYRYDFNTAFSMRAHLGLGYLHSIPGTDRFELNKQGEYEKIASLGRAQVGVKFSISAAYKLSPDFQLSINYGVLGQLPFVKSYVPLLPYNAIQLGILKNISK